MIKQTVLQNFFNKASYLPQLLYDTINWNISSHLKLVKTSYASDTINCAVLQAGRLATSEINAVKYAFQPQVPFSFWLSENPYNEHMLGQKGFVLDETNLAMYCHFSSVCEQHSHPANYQVRQVNDREQVQVFGNTLACIFDPYDDELYRLYQTIAQKGYRSDQHILKLYNGFYNNEPVCAGAVYIEDDYCGIYDIATRPEYRRQGFASSLLHTLLMDVKAQGVKQAYLQADPNSCKLYIQFGFEGFANLKTYVCY